MKNKMTKTALILGSLFLAQNAQAAGMYGGLSMQKSALKLSKSVDNQPGFDDLSTNLSGFIGYEFPKSAWSAYKLSFELSYYGDENSVSSKENKYKANIDMVSLNSINHYHINQSVSFIGVLGVSQVNLKLSESALNSNYHQQDSEHGYGVNYGIGLSLIVPRMYNLDFKNKLEVRTKIVRTDFYDMNTTLNNITEINGLTSISVDFKYNF